MELKYNEFKCEICKGYIKNKNIFLFPCGHMFDMNCIRECLLNYEVSGLDYLHDDNVLIDKISFDLGYINKRVFVEKDKEKEIEEKKGEEKKIVGLIKKIKIVNNLTNLNNNNKYNMNNIKREIKKRII